MPVPQFYSGRFLYHFCHIENLPGVIEHGLLSFNEQTRLGIEHKSIAARSIQERRASMVVPCGPGGVVHDYVPFYFCKRSSMLLSVVNAKNVDQMMLVYFAVPIDVLDRSDVVFTSASANTAIPPTFYSDPAHLAQLQWPLIDSKKWSLPSDAEKQARMAEALVYKRLDISVVDHMIVWNDQFKSLVRKAFEEGNQKAPRIEFDGYNGYYYYTKIEDSKSSLVTGPLVIRKIFKTTSKQLCDVIGKAKNPSFPTLYELRDALREGLNNVAATAELVGLATDNTQHHEDVGNHTLRVVKNLMESPEFDALEATDKLLAEISAYLHDVGKGPRERWKANNYIQKNDPDHPVGGVPIVAKLLEEEVGKMKRRSARTILKLVCYHDLVGDIMGRQRDERQLYDIVEDERDLDMLIAVGKADVNAINNYWWDDAKAAELRERTLKVLKERKSGPDDGEDDDD